MSVAYVPIQSDIDFVLNQTNGAPGWSPADLTRLISGVLVQTGAVATAPAPDLWAASALVLERLVIQKTLDPTQYPGASSVKTADIGVNWKISSTAQLRALCKRYWRMADPVNRETWHSAGWRTVTVEKGDRHDLVDWPFGADLAFSQVVNGTNPFGLAEDVG